MEFTRRFLSQASIRIASPLLITGTLLVVFGIRLFQQSIGIGIDGYYYLLQIDSYSKNGEFLFYTYTPVALYTLVIANSVVGNPVIAVKLCVILFAFLLLAGVFAIAKQITDSSFYSAVAVLIVAISGLTRYLFFEYTSQLIAFVFLLWSVAFILKFTNTGARRWVPLALILFGASVFSHRSILPIAIGLLLCFFLFVFADRAKGQSTRVKAVALSAVVLAIASPLMLRLVPPYPNLFGSAGEITLAPSFPSHFATLPEILILLVIVPLHLWILLSGKTSLSKTSRYFLGTVLIWTVVITLNPFISSSLGFLSVGGRLRTLAFLGVALLVPPLLLILHEQNRKLVWGVIAFASPLLLWSFLSPFPAGAQSHYIQHREKLVPALEQNPTIPRNVSFVVADHGEQFVVTSTTGKPSAHYFPQEPDNYGSIYWLIKGVPQTMVDEEMILLFSDTDGTKTVLAKHGAHWEMRLANSDFRRIVTNLNPHVLVYLTKR